MIVRTYIEVVVETDNAEDAEPEAIEYIESLIGKRRIIDLTIEPVAVYAGTRWEGRRYRVKALVSSV